MKKFFLAILVLVAGAAVFFFASNSRAATETVAYTVEKAEGSFEIRSYPTLHLAQTQMKSPLQAGEDQDGSFMRLFRYIAGGNETQEKIAMTTPVLTTAKGDAQMMNFVMPTASVTKGLPKPKQDVVLQTMPAMKVVAVRFSGITSDQKETEHLSKLREWAKAQGLETTGAPMLAFYDPPWTPGFLRRNEVLLQIKQ
jgi:hypothetical protein